jgi:uncharacterized iron-regulated membrane protein
MARLRKFFFWLHLIGGVLAGLVIFVMATTGVLLTYERQMLDWANASLRAVPAPDAARLPVGKLVAKVQENRGGEAPSGVTWRSDAAAPVTVSFGRETTLYVNPYAGESLGEGAKGWREFFHVVTDVHRWLALEGTQRDTGRAITGACNLAFLFLVLSGIYLWWPQQWRWKVFKAVLVFDGRLRGKARDWNWHNVLGFWACLPLLVIVLSGAVMSYPWANDLLFRIAGSEPPARRAPGAPGGPAGGGGRREGGGKAALDFDKLDQLATRAEQQVSDWQMISWRARRRS